MLFNDFQNQCDNQKFILAMSSTDPEVMKMVGKFINATVYPLSESAFNFMFIFALYTCFKIFILVFISVRMYINDL